MKKIVVSCIVALLFMGCSGAVKETELQIVKKSWMEEAKITSLAQEENNGNVYAHGTLVQTGAAIQMRIPKECGDSFGIGSEVIVLYEQLNATNGFVLENPSEPDVIITMQCKITLEILR
jgi:hypothetical protein